MAIAANIARRSGSACYYARIGIPQDVQCFYIGTKGRVQIELWKSLVTSDAREVRSRAAPIIAQWHAEFEEKRQRRTPSDADFQQATWDHYQSVWM